MRSSVAAATAALNVISSVIGSVSSALTGVAPAMSVVYCGTPLSATGRSNTIVSTLPAADAAVTCIAAVGCGRVTDRPRGRAGRDLDVFIALAIGDSLSVIRVCDWRLELKGGNKARPDASADALPQTPQTTNLKRRPPVRRRSPC